jgi:C4-dicarboxylate transporter DctQ subunit
MLQKLDKILTTVEEFIMVAGLFSASIILFVNIVLRYVFLAGLHWAEEFVRFAIMWIVFIGSSAVARRGDHLSVSALVDNVSPKTRKIMTGFTFLFTILFTGFMAVFGWELTMKFKEMGQVSPSLMLPKYLIYISIPIGGALMTLRFILFFVKKMLPEESRREAKK